MLRSTRPTTVAATVLAPQLFTSVMLAVDGALGRQTKAPVKVNSPYDDEPVKRASQRPNERAVPQLSPCSLVFFDYDRVSVSCDAEQEGQVQRTAACCGCYRIQR